MLYLYIVKTRNIYRGTIVCLKEFQELFIAMRHSGKEDD